MAVVQISKIQIRRGQKNVSGLPQLASGELAWAIDTQELFIGNGAVSEGAPAVGNTKVLTELDNILDLASFYTYEADDPRIQTGPSVSEPISRSLRNKLDDIVNAKDFGVTADGVTDDADALQRAIIQLYINESTKGRPDFRRIIQLPAGEIRLTKKIFIPPFTTLVGNGYQHTILKFENMYSYFYNIKAYKCRKDKKNTLHIFNLQASLPENINIFFSYQMEYRFLSPKRIFYKPSG